MIVSILVYHKCTVQENIRGRIPSSKTCVDVGSGARRSTVSPQMGQLSQPLMIFTWLFNDTVSTEILQHQMIDELEGSDNGLTKVTFTWRN